LERSGVRILLLDDEPFILKLHAHMLKELGFVSVRAFENGSMALADVDAGHVPDLILLDLSMPGMDGIEFIRHMVKRHYAGRLVLVSGEDERLLQTAERLVRAHGIDILGHLSKPVKPAVLRGLLDSWEQRTSFTARGPGKVYTGEELRKAIRNGEIINYYQPKVSTRTGALVGVESLARWQHPSDGIVPPARFIGLAEQVGVIDELTGVVFHKGLVDMRNLEERGLALPLAVNLAVATLNSVEFADFAAGETLRLSMSPANVMIEVTESQLITDQRAPLDVLTRLRLMRFKLSIDDFGTGYSSLTQLRDIPFDELKIDQSFVHRASTDPAARAIYDASLGLAKQLNIKTVAEGVEDRADWEMVRGTECDTAQGYFISRAMPASALPGWAEGWAERVKTLF
jgi:EAL domain-containing protein (putative c-di-GMP-specific phosphodiesterase class I)/ActR/RegA family two-component response regulator